MCNQEPNYKPGVNVKPYPRLLAKGYCETSKEKQNMRDIGILRYRAVAEEKGAGLMLSQALALIVAAFIFFVGVAANWKGDKK